MKLSNRTSIIAIIGLLVFTAITFFIRCYYHEPSGDELLYQYVWEKDDPTTIWEQDHRFEKQISSLDEIIQTQVIHYRSANGRSLVHAVQQSFTNHEIAFSVINTVVFLLFVFLTVKCVAADRRLQKKYSLWFTIVACLLLLFPTKPASLWTSINLGLNYLWPGAISVAVLLIWQQLENCRVNRKWYIPILLLAFIAGWTNEAFVVGIAGGMFIYYCFNLRCFRGQVLWLCIPYWLSVCIMVFAPGNINRFFHGSGDAPFFLKLTNGFDNLLQLWMFWILVVGIIVIFARHNVLRLKQFCADNMKLVLVFIVSFMFSVVANTAPHSLTMVEMMALLLVLRYMCTYVRPQRRPVIIGMVIFTVLFVCQQSVLVYDTMKVYRNQHAVIELYKRGQDNVFVLNEAVCPISKPYIRFLTGDMKVLYTENYTMVFGGKKMELLKPADMEALTAPSTFFVAENRVKGNAFAYKADQGDYMWLNPDSLRAGDIFEADLYPVDFSHDVQFLVKVKFALSPGAYENSEILQVDTVDSQYGRAFRIKPLAVRKIKSIKLIRNEVAEVDSVH